eukprot:8550528-Lingulodinium_polyedra.AAC.1
MEKCGIPMIPLGKQEGTGDNIMGYSSEQVNSFFCNMSKDRFIDFAKEGSLYFGTVPAEEILYIPPAVVVVERVMPD